MHSAMSESGAECCCLVSLTGLWRKGSLPAEAVADHCLCTESQTVVSSSPTVLTAESLQNVLCGKVGFLSMVKSSTIIKDTNI